MQTSAAGRIPAESLVSLRRRLDAMPTRLSEQFNAKPAEIKGLLRGKLDAARTRELADEMRAAGLPL